MLKELMLVLLMLGPVLLGSGLGIAAAQSYPRSPSPDASRLDDQRQQDSQWRADLQQQIQQRQWQQQQERRQQEQDARLQQLERWQRRAR